MAVTTTPFTVRVPNEILARLRKTAAEEKTTIAELLLRAWQINTVEVSDPLPRIEPAHVDPALASVEVVSPPRGRLTLADVRPRPEFGARLKKSKPSKG